MMKKLILVLIVSALFAISYANAQSTTDDVATATKKAAKATSKGVGKGYKASKKAVVKSTKAAVNGVKKIFK
jgi:hypothetical protein